jgi:hypothetical protein
MDIVSSKSPKLLKMWQEKFWERKKKYSYHEVQALITQQCKKLDDELLLTLRRCRDLTEENQRLEARLGQQCNQARTDELECATVPDYFIWNKDGVSMTVGERKAQLAQAKETEVTNE